MMTSEQAAHGWNKPIRLLWIDGDEAAKLDFTLWEPHLVEGGILAMHDTIRKKGPKRVLWECVFRSGRFQEIASVDNITAVRKVRRTSTAAILRNYWTLGLRAVYIAASFQKSRAETATPAHGANVVTHSDDPDPWTMKRFPGCLAARNTNVIPPAKPSAFDTDDTSH